MSHLYTDQLKTALLKADLSILNAPTASRQSNIDHYSRVEKQGVRNERGGRPKKPAFPGGGGGEMPKQRTEAYAAKTHKTAYEV